MITRIISIGNSRGVRIPKAILEDCGFGDEAELAVKNGALIIRPLKASRSGWNEQFARAGGKVPAVAEDSPSNRFDEEEWEW